MKVTAALLASVILLAVTLTAASADTTFYVATGGNDTWSGASGSPNRARTDGPFATLQRAREAVRALQAKGPLTAPVRILVRQGTYFLTEPLALGPEDSGTEQCPIT